MINLKQIIQKFVYFVTFYLFYEIKTKLSFDSFYFSFYPFRTPPE